MQNPQNIRRNRFFLPVFAFAAGDFLGNTNAPIRAITKATAKDMTDSVGSIDGDERTLIIWNITATDIQHTNQRRRKRATLRFL